MHKSLLPDKGLRMVHIQGVVETHSKRALPHGWGIKGVVGWNVAVDNGLDSLSRKLR
jgi:hypothetical protein